MFRNMFMIEHTKIFRQTILWVEIALLAGVAVLIQVVLFAALQIMPANEQTPEAVEPIYSMLTWPGALTNILNISSGMAIGSMLVIILVGAVTSQEYHWRTLHLWLGHGVSRFSYAAARFLALFLPMLLMIVTALLVGGLSSAGFSLLLNGSLGLDQINAAQVALSVLRSAYSLLPYAALAFLLAVASRSAVMAIGGGLAFSFLIENVLSQVFQIMGGVLAVAARYLPLNLANTIVRLNQAIVSPAPALPEDALPALTAVIGIAVYTLLFFGLAAYLLRKQDLTA